MSAGPVFRYLERVPEGACAPWVLSAWCFQADATPTPSDPYTVWPDGCVSIGLLRGPHLPPQLSPTLVFVGPRHESLRPHVVAGMRLWGIRLWPDALRCVVGEHLDPRSLRDQVGPMPSAIGARFTSLAAALPATDEADIGLSAILRWADTALASSTEPEPRVRAAVRAIVNGRGDVAMEDVARTAGLGLRQLQRRFPERTGLTLREYARIRRLREALARRLAAPANGWSQIAAESGFVDHAHLTREFQALSGLPPSIVSRQLDRTAHHNVVP